MILFVECILSTRSFATRQISREMIDNLKVKCISAAKGIPASYGIFFVSSRHVESIALLQNGKR